MGMRRSGKTWAAFQQIQLRQNQGLAKDTNLYINFEDVRLSGFEVSDFQHMRTLESPCFSWGRKMCAYVEKIDSFFRL